MTPRNPKPFDLFAVVALKRPTLTESIIALKPKEDAARRAARQYMAAMPDEFVRCRVQPMTLTLAEVKGICFQWGQEDARSGDPVLNTLPGVYREEYLRGYESVKTLLAQVAPTARSVNEEGTDPTE